MHHLDWAGAGRRGYDLFKAFFFFFFFFAAAAAAALAAAASRILSVVIQEGGVPRLRAARRGGALTRRPPAGIRARGLPARFRTCAGARAREGRGGRSPLPSWRNGMRLGDRV
jgi:hypothetical protein